MTHDSCQSSDTGSPPRGMSMGGKHILILSILGALPAVACGNTALSLHPSVETNWSKGEGWQFGAHRIQYKAGGNTPLVLSGKVPTGTLESVPAALNLGLMLRVRSKYAKADQDLGCQESTEDSRRRRIERLRRQMEDSWGNQRELPRVGCPESGFEEQVVDYASASLDLLYRRFDSELSTTSSQQAGARVADVDSSEYALRLSLGNAKSRGFSFGLSLAVGYVVPRIARNYGLFPDIASKGGVTFALGYKIYYWIAEWLYVYVTVSVGGAGAPTFTTGSTTYRRSYGSMYIPTYAGVGLGLGFQIPIARF